jgi:plasmid stabilization system protein ParE
MKRPRFATAAKSDLKEINSYYLEKSGPEVAAKVIGRIRTAIQALTMNPGLGHFREDLNPKKSLRFYPVFSDLIAFRQVDKTIEVARVLHGYRDVQNLL